MNDKLGTKPSCLSLNQKDIAACMAALQPVVSTTNLRTWRAPARFIKKLNAVIWCMKAKDYGIYKIGYHGQGWSTAEKLAYAIRHQPGETPYWSEYELALLHLLLARESLQ